MNLDQIVDHWQGRPTHAVIDLDAFAQNVRTMRAHIREEARYCVVVKANGYGLGAIPLARVAIQNGADMLAVAEVGAQWTVLPATLPAEALAQRLEEVGARVVFTQDGAWRHGTVLPLKARRRGSASSARSWHSSTEVANPPSTSRPRCTARCSLHFRVPKSSPELSTQVLTNR